MPGGTTALLHHSRFHSCIFGGPFKFIFWSQMIALLPLEGLNFHTRAHRFSPLLHTLPATDTWTPPATARLLTTILRWNILDSWNHTTTKSICHPSGACTTPDFGRLEYGRFTHGIRNLHGSFVSAWALHSRFCTPSLPLWHLSGICMHANAGHLCLDVRERVLYHHRASIRFYYRHKQKTPAAFTLPPAGAMELRSVLCHRRHMELPLNRQYHAAINTGGTFTAWMPGAAFGWRDCWNDRSIHHHRCTDFLRTPPFYTPTIHINRHPFTTPATTLTLEAFRRMKIKFVTGSPPLSTGLPLWNRTLLTFCTFTGILHRYLDILLTTYR